MSEKHPARYYEPGSEESVRCVLCPHHCHISKGKNGLCGARANENGKLYSLNYGVVSGMGMDPIEKKPLYHYHPSKQIFSIGTVGCNLDCPFCQNYHISRYFDNRGFAQLDHYTPEEIVKAASDSDSFAIAYTYSEPAVWFEYVADVSRIAHEKGLKNVWVTNGYIEQPPLQEILPLMDAANIDLKAFDEKAYRELRGKLDPVQRTIAALHGAGVHIELTTLIVPGLNDDLVKFEKLARWIASLDRKIPFHISRYFPRYRYHREATDLRFLDQVRGIATGHLDYVYLGNTGGGSDTHCPSCGNLLVHRNGYTTKIAGISKAGDDYLCSNCGSPVDIVME